MENICLDMSIGNIGKEVRKMWISKKEYQSILERISVLELEVRSLNERTDFHWKTVIESRKRLSEIEASLSANNNASDG